MRVLGLDPGTQRTGWGVVGFMDGELTRCGGGVLELAGASLAERLAHLHAQLMQLLDVYQPTTCAVEGLFYHRNVRSALVLGHARGVCLMAAAANGLEVVEYPPATVKRALTGHGAADKQRVGFMVARVLKTSQEPSLDASDALAVALCHLENRQPLTVME